MRNSNTAISSMFNAFLIVIDDSAAADTSYTFVFFSFLFAGCGVWCCLYISLLLQIYLVGDAIFRSKSVRPCASHYGFSRRHNGLSFLFVLGKEVGNRLKLHRNGRHNAGKAEIGQFHIVQIDARQQGDNAMIVRSVRMARLHVITELSNAQECGGIASCKDEISITTTTKKTKQKCVKSYAIFWEP